MKHEFHGEFFSTKTPFLKVKSCYSTVVLWGQTTVSLRILLVPDHMAIGAIDRLDPRKVAGCTCLLRHFATEFIIRSSLCISASKHRQHRKLGWYHFYDTICDLLRVILASFSALLKHIHCHEKQKGMAAARRQFEAKLCFLSLL